MCSNVQGNYDRMEKMLKSMYTESLLETFVNWSLVAELPTLPGCPACALLSDAWNESMSVTN